MDIASMLNEPARSTSGSRVREQRPSFSSIQGGFTAPSYSLPTPSPEWMSSPDASDYKHERPRRAWDAGGYSLPLIPKTQSPYEANIPARFPEDYSYPDRPFLHHSSSDDYHSRHGSTDSFGAWSPEVLTPLDNSRLDRSTSSVYEPREYISRDRSFINEPFNPRRPSRSKSYTEQPFDVATVGSKSLRHKISDSRSSLSSYSSSTFSGGHSRLSSMSTVNSAHFPRSLSTDVPMLDGMMEETPTPTFPRHVGSGRGPMVESSSLSGRDLVSSPITSQPNTKRKRSRQTDNTSSTGQISPLRISTEVSDLHQRVLEQAQSLGLEFGERLVGKPDICLFIENCTSRENIRKAISHIFGRNKVCTRRIPERVWVSVCRKHYQRTRYRQGAAYAKTQVHFVFSQIVRLLFWSFGYEQDSQVNAERVTITSWTFSIRKGELNRLAREDEESQTPHWVLEHLGSGKTNEEIFEIALRLKSEIDNQILVDFPPIEFLPEVVELPTHTSTSTIISPVEEGSSRAAEMSSRNTTPGPRAPSSDAASNARAGEYRNEAFNNVSQLGVPSRGLHWDMAERVPLPNPYLPNRRPRVNIANSASISTGYGPSSEPRVGIDRQAAHTTREEDGIASRNCQHSSLPTITEVEVNDATQTSESPDEESNTTDPYAEGRGVFGSYFSHRRANICDNIARSTASCRRTSSSCRPSSWPSLSDYPLAFCEPPIQLSLPDPWLVAASSVWQSSLLHYTPSWYEWNAVDHSRRILGILSRLRLALDAVLGSTQLP